MHQAGRFGEAEALYRQLPQNDPNILQLLGVLCFQTHRRAEGKELFELALQIDPNHVEALTNLGVANHEEKKFEDALALFERALVLEPNRQDLLNKKGFILQDLNRHEDAIRQFEAALHINSKFTEALFNLGHSFSRLGRYDRAENAYSEIIRIEPSNYEAWSNLSESLFKMHRFKESIEASKKSISIHPTASAYHNLGQGLTHIGASEAGLKATKVAIQLNPKAPIHHAALGDIFLAQSRYEEALDAYRNAIRFDSTNHTYFLKLAESQFQSGDYRASIATYSGLDSPAARFLSTLTTPIVPSSYAELRETREGVWQSLSGLDIHNSISDPLIEIARLPFHLNYQDELDLPMNLAVAKAYVDACPSLAWESPMMPSRHEGKIKVGIISSTLNRHSTGRWFLQIAAGLADEDIELTFYDTGTKADDWTSYLVSKAVKSERIFPDLQACRQKIAEQKFDALFFPEIGMDPLTYYLSFARLAPFQFTTAGSPWSTGHANVDVFVSGRDMETADSDSHYSERLVRTNAPLFVFEKGQVPPTSRHELGLPDNKRIYFCPQPAMKIHPLFDDAINEILDRDSDGVVVLISGRDRGLAKLLDERFKRVMPDKSDRIITLAFLTYDQYLGLCACADVGLDTFYFGGGNSSLDMLSVGTPVVTWPQEFLKGRITHSLYKTMGMQGLSVGSRENYVKLAVEVAQNPDRRKILSEEIQAKNEVLFMNRGAIEEFKALIRRECRP